MQKLFVLFWNLKLFQFKEFWPSHFSTAPIPLHFYPLPSPPPLAVLARCFAGDDLRNLCQAALMQAVAKVEDATHFRRVRGPSPLDPTALADDLLEPCPPDVPGAARAGQGRAG